MNGYTIAGIIAIIIAVILVILYYISVSNTSGNSIFFRRKPPPSSTVATIQPTSSGIVDLYGLLGSRAIGGTAIPAGSDTSGDIETNPVGTVVANYPEQTQNTPVITPTQPPPRTSYPDCPSLHYSADYEFIPRATTYGVNRYLTLPNTDTLPLAMAKCSADSRCAGFETTSQYYKTGFTAPQYGFTTNPCIGMFVKKPYYETHRDIFP